MGSFELALGVGTDLFCGVAFGAVGIETDVGVKIGEGGPIVFLAEMDEGEQPVDFGLLRGEGFRFLSGVQRGFEMHAIELEFSQFVIANPGVWIELEAAAQKRFAFDRVVAAEEKDGQGEDGVRVGLIAERDGGSQIFLSVGWFLQREAGHADLIVRLVVIGSFCNGGFEIAQGAFGVVAGIKLFLAGVHQLSCGGGQGKFVRGNRRVERLIFGRFSVWLEEDGDAVLGAEIHIHIHFKGKKARRGDFQDVCVCAQALEGELTGVGGYRFSHAGSAVIAEPNGSVRDALIGGFGIDDAVQIRGWIRHSGRSCSTERGEESKQREKGSEHGSLRPEKDEFYTGEE
jgi:hypothetical protein